MWTSEHGKPERSNSRVFRSFWLSNVRWGHVTISSSRAPRDLVIAAWTRGDCTLERSGSHLASLSERYYQGKGAALPKVRRSSGPQPQSLHSTLPQPHEWYHSLIFNSKHLRFVEWLTSGNDFHSDTSGGRFHVWIARVWAEKYNNLEQVVPTTYYTYIKERMGTRSEDWWFLWAELMRGGGSHAFPLTAFSKFPTSSAIPHIDRGLIINAHRRAGISWAGSRRVSYAGTAAAIQCSLY